MNFLLFVLSSLLLAVGVLAVQQMPMPARAPTPRQTVQTRPAQIAVQQRARPSTATRRIQQKPAVPLQRAAKPISPSRPIPLPNTLQQPPKGMVKQCQCKDIEPCKERYMDAVEPCLDSCRHHIISLGGNYEQVKQCFTPKESLLKAAMKCTENQHANACSKQSTIQFIPKRYAQTLENAAMAEVDRMISRMGLDKSPPAKKLVSTSKKLFGCVKQCMSKRENCEKRLNCGLQLPSDQVIVQNTKRCAMNSGFNTANAQQMCHCAAKAGVKDLKSVCQKIIIS